MNAHRSGMRHHFSARLIINIDLRCWQAQVRFQFKSRKLSLSWCCEIALLLGPCVFSCRSNFGCNFLKQISFSQHAREFYVQRKSFLDTLRAKRIIHDTQLNF